MFTCSYLELLKLLTRARDFLPECAAPVLPAEIGGWVTQRPFAEVCAADAACAGYAANGRWPMLANDVAAELHLRIEAAMELCAAMGRKRMEMSLSEAFELMLVDYWKGKGLEWAKWKYGPGFDGNAALN